MQRTRAGMWAVLVIVGSAALQAGCGGGGLDVGDGSPFDQAANPDDVTAGDVMNGDDDLGYVDVGPGALAAGPVTVSAGPGHAVVHGPSTRRTIDHTRAMPTTHRPPSLPARCVTSGTTGTPKGAAWDGRWLSSALGVLERMPYRGGDVAVIPTPLFHAWWLVQLHRQRPRRLRAGRRFTGRRSTRWHSDERRCSRRPVMLQRILAADATVATPTLDPVQRPSRCRLVNRHRQRANTLSYVGQPCARTGSRCRKARWTPRRWQVNVGVNCGIEPARFEVGSEAFSFPLLAGTDRGDVVRWPPPTRSTSRSTTSPRRIVPLSCSSPTCAPTATVSSAACVTTVRPTAAMFVISTASGNADGLSFDGSTVMYTGTFEHIVDELPQPRPAAERTPSRNRRRRLPAFAAAVMRGATWSATPPRRIRPLAPTSSHRSRDHPARRDPDGRSGSVVGVGPTVGRPPRVDELPRRRASLAGRGVRRAGRPGPTRPSRGGRRFVGAPGRRRVRATTSLERGRVSGFAGRRGPGRSHRPDVL